MPSIDIHIAIARKYLKKHKDIKDKIAFIKGNLEPDLVDDRSTSHFTKKSNKADLSDILKNKIQLNEYLKTTKISDDYEKGYFLHLVTDYIFFNNFIDEEYIKNTDYSDFKKDLYYSYNLAHDYLNDNYDINYHPFQNEIKKRISTSQTDENYNGEKRTNIIPFDKLDKFINEILEKDIISYQQHFGIEIQRKTIENDEKYLRQISQPVLLNDGEYKNEIKLLEKFCLGTECFALAAVQIGIPKRMIYLKNTTLEVPLEDIKYNEAKILINPVIISRKGHTKFWEACLSCLDNMGLVSRPYEMIVQYYDCDGNEHNEMFTGFEATVLSHELDHLDGILHMDIAEEVINMPKEERKTFREQHPYEIISKNCEYNSIISKKLKIKS